MTSPKTRRGDSPNRVKGVSSDYEQALAVKMEKPRRTLGARIARWFLWVFLAVNLILAVFAIFFLPKIAEQNEVLRQQTEDTYNPGFKSRFDGLGQTVIEQWYAPEPSESIPVALADGVEWPDSTFDPETTAAFDVQNVSFLSGETKRKDGSQYEERLTYIATVNGFNQGIQITFVIPDIYNPKSTPVLAASPSFVSIPLGDPSIVNLKPTGGSVSSTDSIQTQLDSWAKAWTENDPAAIKQATGDNSGSNFYLGLYPGTWTYVDESLKIEWAQYVGTGETEAYVRATWQMKAPDQIIETQDDSGADITIVKTGLTMTQTMEFLVTDPNSGLPRIVDWGPVGSASAESLEEYGAAVDKEFYERTMNLLGRSPSTTPTSPTQSPSPDGTSTPTPDPTTTPAEGNG